MEQNLDTTIQPGSSPIFGVSENSVHAIGEAKSSSDRASEHTCAMRFTDPQPRYGADFMAYCIREHVS